MVAKTPNQIGFAVLLRRWWSSDSSPGSDARKGLRDHRRLSPRLPLYRLKNLPILLTAMVFAPTRIRALIGRVTGNQHFNPSGHYAGQAQMILGLLYKTKKKRTPALQHLTEAKQILSQFGQTPILARVETALAELG